MHVEIWDVPTKTKISRFGGDHFINTNLVIFPDGQHLVYSSCPIARIWNIPTGNLVQSLVSEGFYRSFAVAPDCKQIASVKSDGTIRVQEWESTSVSRTPTPNGHDGLHCLHYIKAQLSLGGRYLILEGWNLIAGKVYLQILNTVTMSEVTNQVQLRTSKPITVVSPDDQYIAYTVTNGLCLWSIVRGEVVLDGSNCDFTALAFSLNSDYLISGDRNGNVIIWNTHTCQPSKMMTSEGHITALAFSAVDTRFLVVYFPNTDESESIVEIHDSQSGKISKGPFTPPVKDSDYGRHFVAFSSNESRIIWLISYMGFVLDAETGQILNTFKLESAGDFLHLAENFLQLSPNRKYLWSKVVSYKGIPENIGEELQEIDEKSWDIHEKFWDIDEGMEIEGQWFTSEADTTAFFSNNPEEILTIHKTGVINFWHIGTGNKTMMLMFHPQLDGMPCLSVSSNENRLVLVSEGSIKVWSLEGRGEFQAMSCVYEDQAKTEQ